MARFFAWVSGEPAPEPPPTRPLPSDKPELATLRERARHRPVRKTSIRYLRIADRIWWILFPTLALDLIIFHFAARSLAAPFFVEVGFIVSSICAAVAVLGLWRSRILPWIYRFGELRNQLFARSDRGWWIVVSIVALLGLIELSARVAEIPPVSRIIASVISLVAVWKTIRAFKESREYLQRLQEDKIAWVEHANLTIFLIHVIPTVAARLFVLGAVIASIDLQDPLMVNGTPGGVWCALIVGSLAMVALKPRDEDFVVKCVRCGFVTSRALEQLKVCPACAPGFFWGKRNEAQ